jgi:aminoglycoside N3'-acetyltransferase
MINQADFGAALRAAGLRKGDTVLAHGGVAKFGKVDALPKRDDILRFYLTGLLDAVGVDGTIVTPTFSGTHYVRKCLTSAPMGQTSGIA